MSERGSETGQTHITNREKVTNATTDLWAFYTLLTYTCSTDGGKCSPNSIGRTLLRLKMCDSLSTLKSRRLLILPSTAKKWYHTLNWWIKRKRSEKYPKTQLKVPKTIKIISQHRVFSSKYSHRGTERVLLKMYMYMRKMWRHYECASVPSIFDSMKQKDTMVGMLLLKFSQQSREFEYFKWITLFKIHKSPFIIFGKRN